MRGKAQTADAAKVALVIADSINEWAALSDLLMQAGSVADTAESETKAALWAQYGPKGLLSPPPPPMPPVANQDEMIRANRLRALRAHREAWSASAPYVWLCTQPGFSAALESLLTAIERLLTDQKHVSGTSDALQREARAIRLIVNAVMDWAIVRTGSETHDLKLYLNRDQMREAAKLASKLERVLGAAFWSGSEVTTQSYKTGRASTTLRQLLKRLAADLSQRDAERGRAPRNDPGAADRWLIATLANRFHGELGDEYRPAIVRIVWALGIDLHRTVIEDALNKAPNIRG
jgi:hypothetical protein